MTSIQVVTKVLLNIYLLFLRSHLIGHPVSLFITFDQIIYHRVVVMTGLTPWTMMVGGKLLVILSRARMY